jgi:hypothetical protein
MMRAKRTVMNAWRTVAIAVVALSALSAASAQFPNLVQDPSFETTISTNNYGSPPTTWFAGQSFGSTPGGNPNETRRSGSLPSEASTLRGVQTPVIRTAEATSSFD